MIIFDLAFWAKPYGIELIDDIQPSKPQDFGYMYLRITLWLFSAFYLNFLFIDSLYVKLKLFDRAPYDFHGDGGLEENRFFTKE